ncbi:class I SAM-dependent methyltransferase [Marimonas arenosa]|uniref:Class I SAM-dependent methyltransferase n=1 Tax=Marimonas arenosa TaxID=1795305 RepID=A0AAE3WHL8_9RHOB|nr:class I SAM-dependent methyltransferase [Marimonas arenosa]MDQ2091738.1 class I SAM-dependent methyltransferase [Marimonas arenosa]
MSDAAFWNRIARKYANSPVGDMEAYEATLDRVRSYLHPDSEALEIGCGTGTTALKLAPFTHRIEASDVSAAMVDIAREKATVQRVRNVGFTVAPAEAPPEGRFDVVMSFNLLHLLRDLDSTLAQVAARVKPDGLFISKTICLAGPGLPWGMRALLLGLPLMQMIGKAPYVAKLSVTGLESAITRAGFEIIETGDYPDRPSRRFIVARKAP